MRNFYSKKKLIAAFMLAFCFILSGCMPSFYLSSEIPNYNDYLLNLEQFAPLDAYSQPKIEGFEPSFTHGFTDAQPFVSNNTYVYFEKQGYILNQTAKLRKTNIKNIIKVVDDMVIFKSGDFFGVKDLNSNLILDSKYNEIDILDNLILAKKGDRFELYQNTLLISQGSFFIDVQLINNSVIKIDNNYFNLDLTEFKLFGYSVISHDEKNNFIITNELFLGLANSNSVIIEPFYLSILSYITNNGSLQYAIVLENSAYKIIDADYNTIFSVPYSSVQIPIFYNGNNSLYLNTISGLIGIGDSQLNVITAAFFNSIYANNIFGDYLILQTPNLEESLYNFYSIKHQLNLSTIYKNITPYNDFFIIENLDNKFSLLSASTLEPLIENCDSISFSSNILLISINEYYFFYNRA